MKGALKITMRNEATALPRILRLINRQGLSVRKLVMQPSEDVRSLELLVVLDCAEVSQQLVKLLQKQISVLVVQVAV